MTPLERGARALCAEAFQDPDEVVTTVGDKPVCAWEYKILAARAVIEAIREPSSPMTHAAQSESHVSGDCEVDYHGIWASMIDALLEEGAQGSAAEVQQPNVYIEPSRLRRLLQLEAQHAGKHIPI